MESFAAVAQGASSSSSGVQSVAADAHGAPSSSSGVHEVAIATVRVCVCGVCGVCGVVCVCRIFNSRS
jgi:hypothetical protein